MALISNIVRLLLLGGCFFVALGGGNLLAGDPPSSGVGSSIDREEFRTGAIQQRIQERNIAVETLKTQLNEAQTSEEKRRALDTFRSEIEVISQQTLQRTEGGERRQINFEELKRQAAGDSARLARIDDAEVRFQIAATIKEKLVAASNAADQGKRILLEEIEQEKTRLVTLQKAALDSRLQRVNQGVDVVKDSPPEMVALEAKSEARKKEIDQLQEALGKATREERSGIIENWLQKRRAELVTARSESSQAP